MTDLTDDIPLKGLLELRCKETRAEARRALQSLFFAVQSRGVSLRPERDVAKVHEKLVLNLGELLLGDDFDVERLC